MAIRSGASNNIITEVSTIWEPPTISEFCKSVQAEPLWLIEDFLPADCNSLISGKAKVSYKSWLAFLMAMTVASGRRLGPFQPTHSEGLSTLILEAEGGRPQTKWSWLALEKGYDVPLDEIPLLRFSHRENIILDDQDWIKRTADFVDRHQTKLIIVDPFVMFSRGNENDVHDVVKLLRTFNLWRGLTNCGVIFIHHLSKSQKDWKRDIDEELRGSSSLAGFYDQHLALRQYREGQDYNELIIRSKHDEERRYEIRWHISKTAGTAQMELITSSKEASLEHTANELLGQMLEGESYTKSRLEQILGLDGDASSLLEEMVKNNQLVRDGRYYSLGKPKKEISDDSKLS